jgi:hypothetical protein
MDVVGDPDGARLERLQDGLSYPWLDPDDLAARYEALAGDASGSFTFAREFARPAR